MRPHIPCVVQADGYKTTLYPHLCKTTPKGTILVLHGMIEHHDRYNEFADMLNANGYDVYLFDYRGHGLDKKREELGFVAERNGDRRLIRDALDVMRQVRDQNRGEAFFLFGHSLGSMIARCVIQYDDDIDGVIVMGTSYPGRAYNFMGVRLASLIKRFKGSHHISYYLHKMMFGGKNYTALSERTAFDWLSRSNASVGAYIHDACCGFVCTTSFYLDVAKIAYYAGSRNMMKRTRKDLPITLLSGTHDPVGAYGQEVTNLFDAYQRLGFTMVDCTLYAECRHELLHELNRKEVMADIVKWCDTTFKKERISTSSVTVSAHHPESIEEDAVSQVAATCTTDETDEAVAAPTTAE